MILSISKLNLSCLSSFKQLSKCYSQMAGPSAIKLNATQNFNLIIESNFPNTPQNPNTTSYICPSFKTLKFSINDFKITDIIKRHELTLPEIHKNKVVQDPLLNFQIEKQLPQINEKKNTPLSCGQSLFNERKWRSRKMNIKKKKKYEQKLFYVIQRRRQNKDKRFENIKAMFKGIHEKKVELFEPHRFIDRELEKAKFYGFKCSPVYDEYRNIVQSKMNTFDQNYFRKFDDPKIPLHIKLNIQLKK